MTAPENPYVYAMGIQYAQDRYDSYHNILFNKGRYFETSFYNNDVLNEISSLTGLPIEFNNMICGSWTKMQDFVDAMNCLGIYVTITVDWI